MNPSDPVPSQSLKKCRRYNDPGHAHALTFSCYRRQRFLTSDRACQWLADAVAKARQRHDFLLWAYVFMPEHVHLLICPRPDDYDVSKILDSLKLSVVRRALPYVKKNGPEFLKSMLDRQPNGRTHYRFWQRGGGFDRNITSEHAAVAEIEYIHANPVRRGLCDTPTDWRWSSAADYAGLRTGPLAIDFHSLPRTYVLGAK